MDSTLELSVFADYFQFYLLDETAQEEAGILWTEEAVERMLVAQGRTVGIGTARNMAVPVAISVLRVEPENDFDAWDMVNDCSLSLPSGTLVILGGTAYFPDAPRMTLEPGDYRVRVSYAGLGTLSADGLEGDDFYRIQLWPGRPRPLLVRKPRGGRAA